MSLLARESFLANLRAMPPGPEYGALADHDAELRRMIDEAVETTRLLLTELSEGMIEEWREVAGNTNARCLLNRIESARAMLATIKSATEAGEESK